MVKALKFLTPFALDVMAYSLCKMLRAPGRDKLKADGINSSGWMRGLEIFTGEFFERYPYVELRPIVNYIVTELKEGRTSSLGVVKELLKKMGGVDTVGGGEGGARMQGRAGGEVLRRETSAFGVVVVSGDTARKKLLETMAGGEGVAKGTAMILLANGIKDAAGYGAGNKGQRGGLKYVGNVVDEVTDVVEGLVEVRRGGTKRKQEERRDGAVTALT